MNKDVKKTLLDMVELFVATKDGLGLRHYEDVLPFGLIARQFDKTGLSRKMGGW
jgi:hypothetical protein